MTLCMARVPPQLPVVPGPTHIRVCIIDLRHSFSVLFPCSYCFLLQVNVSSRTLKMRGYNRNVPPLYHRDQRPSPAPMSWESQSIRSGTASASQFSLSSSYVGGPGGGQTELLYCQRQIKERMLPFEVQDYNHNRQLINTNLPNFLIHTNPLLMSPVTFSIIFNSVV